MSSFIPLVYYSQISPYPSPSREPVFCDCCQDEILIKWNPIPTHQIHYGMGLCLCRVHTFFSCPDAKRSGIEDDLANGVRLLDDGVRVTVTPALSPMDGTQASPECSSC